MNLIVKSFAELTTNELYEILKARAEIFIMEQSILYQDMDDIDYKALHFFIMESTNVVAYFRAFYTNDEDVVQIGRVLTLEHGRGLGKYLLENGLVLIKEKMNCKKICMDAQKHAVGFYEQFGFRVISDDFLEEGVIHQKMELDI